MEGMFIINTTPLNHHKTMEEYSHLLIRWFVTVTSLSQGNGTEVHMLFDNPGQMEDKRFEQVRRYLSLSTDHLCWVFFNEAEISSKWNVN